MAPANRTSKTPDVRQTNPAASRAIVAPANRTVNAIAIVLIALVVAASFVLAGWLPGGAAASTENPVAVVHDADGNTYRLPLNQNTTLQVRSSMGTNEITVEGGQVYVSESDCDGHNCMRQGRIDAPGTQLICLPHRLWIEVVTDGPSGHLNPDVVAGDGGFANDEGGPGQDGAGAGQGSEALNGETQSSEFQVDTNSR